MPDDGLPALYRGLGRYSRLFGLGFIALSCLFLLLSVYYQFIVFEVDSVVAFVAAIILLFRDPRARVHINVFDALQLSSDEVIRELSGNLGTGFCYVPTGERIRDIVLIPTPGAPGGLPDGAPSVEPNLPTLTPPGRGLAELYRREAGLVKVTMDAIRSSLSEFLSEDFALARSAEIKQEGERVQVVLHHPSSRCTCSELEPGQEGRVGCTVASFLAVLVASATGRALFLDECIHDPTADTWTVTMRLGPSTAVGA